VRIIYRDGLEVDRQTTVITVIEPAQDEIMMIGIGAAAGNLTFCRHPGLYQRRQQRHLAGQQRFSRTAKHRGNLDQRVFTLSPNGDYLLYTRTTTETTSFNSLWVIRHRARR
jgi:resuscitation-promoting factor RpfB